jgi:hypothetical protein
MLVSATPGITISAAVSRTPIRASATGGDMAGTARRNLDLFRLFPTISDQAILGAARSQEVVFMIGLRRM